MKVAIFSTKSYDRQFFTAANSQHQHQLTFLEPKLDRHTAILAKDATAVCIFVNDEVDKDTLTALASHNVSLIALRSAGYNNVDVQAAKNLGIKLVRVPAYSPYAVAEHTVGLILTLNRKLHRAYNLHAEINWYFGADEIKFGTLVRLPILIPCLSSSSGDSITINPDLSKKYKDNL